jgi:hypothetical protein
LTLATAALPVLNQWTSKGYFVRLAPWLMAVHHALQGLVILILMLALIPDHSARLAKPRREAVLFAERVQCQFYEYFRYVWFTWFLLYAVMASFAFVVQSSIDEEWNGGGKGREQARAGFVNYLISDLGVEAREISPRLLDPATPASGGGSAGDSGAAGLPVDRPRGAVGEGDGREGANAKAGETPARPPAPGTGEVGSGKADAARLPGDSPRSAGPFDASRVRDVAIGEDVVRKAVDAADDRDLLHPGRSEATIIGQLRRFRNLFLVQDLLVNLFGNLQNLALFACYFVLLGRRDPGTNAPARPPLAYPGLAVFLLALLEFVGVVGSMHLHSLRVFTWLTSMFGGVMMAMTFSLLVDRRMATPEWIAVCLYAYAVSQGASTLPTATLAERVTGAVIYTGYLLGKLLFYAYTLWLLRSGLLLFAIHVRVAAGSRDERSRARFLENRVVVR